MPALLVPLSGLLASLGTGALVTGLQSILGSLAIFGGTALGGALLNIGLSFGLSYLTSLFRPKPPGPEDVQQSSRQPLSPRVRHYGRVKASGVWLFAESKSGYFYKVLGIGTGQADAIEEIYVDQTQVTLNGSNMVQEDPWDSAKLRIETRLGLPTETHYSNLTSAFSTWTSDHRLDGIVTLYAKQYPVTSDKFYEYFPNSINTLYRVVMRGCLVENPITNATAWDDNAAAVLMDYCRHSDGARMPASLFATPLAVEMWQAAYTACETAIPLKAGGTEPQWRLWGSYNFSERPGDVIARMQASCDGRLVPTRDGGIGLEVLEWAEPGVVVDTTMITGFNDLAQGRDITQTANIISATYLSPDHDYQTTDAESWIDEADVSDRGEIELNTSFIMSPSHGQCRRLMKRTAYRANPKWRGAFELNVKGIACYGERLIRIAYPLFGIDEVFEIQDFRFKIGDGGLLQGCVIQVSSMPEESCEWNAATEEGDPEPYEETNGVTTIPATAGFSVVITRENISGVQIPFGSMSWTDDGSDALETDAEYKKTADSEWTAISVAPGAVTVKSQALTDNTSYDFRIRHRTLVGRKGNWSSVATINVVADTSAPGVLTGVSGTGGVGTAALAWTSPNSANYVAANIRRNTVNTEGSATLIQTEYGPASTADSYTDGGLAAGTYYYWLKARNGSGVESASVATGAVVVT